MKNYIKMLHFLLAGFALFDCAMIHAFVARPTETWLDRFHRAIQLHDTKAAQDILDQTKDVDLNAVKSASGPTLLIKATACGDLDIVKLLLYRGADASMKAGLYHHETALRVAIQGLDIINGAIEQASQNENLSDTRERLKASKIRSEKIIRILQAYEQLKPLTRKQQRLLAHPMPEKPILKNFNFKNFDLNQTPAQERVQRNAQKLEAALEKGIINNHHDAVENYWFWRFHKAYDRFILNDNPDMLKQLLFSDLTQEPGIMHILRDFFVSDTFFKDLIARLAQTPDEQNIATVLISNLQETQLLETQAEEYNKRDELFLEQQRLASQLEDQMRSQNPALLARKADEQKEYDKRDHMVIENILERHGQKNRAVVEKNEADQRTRLASNEINKRNRLEAEFVNGLWEYQK